MKATRFLLLFTTLALAPQCYSPSPQTQVNQDILGYINEAITGSVNEPDPKPRPNTKEAFALMTFMIPTTADCSEEERAMFNDMRYKLVRSLGNCIFEDIALSPKYVTRKDRTKYSLEGRVYNSTQHHSASNHLEFDARFKEMQNFIDTNNLRGLVQEHQNEILVPENRQALAQQMANDLFNSEFKDLTQKTTFCGSQIDERSKKKLLAMALAGPENCNFLNGGPASLDLTDNQDPVRKVLGCPSSEPLTLENIAKHKDKAFEQAKQDPKLLGRLKSLEPVLGKEPSLVDFFTGLDKITDPEKPEPSPSPTTELSGTPAQGHSKMFWMFVIGVPIIATAAGLVITEKLLFKYRPGWWKKIKNKLLGTKEIWVKE